MKDTGIEQPNSECSKVAVGTTCSASALKNNHPKLRNVNVCC